MLYARKRLRCKKKALQEERKEGQGIEEVVDVIPPWPPPDTNVTHKLKETHEGTLVVCKCNYRCTAPRGPFRITQILRDGCYVLPDLEGNSVGGCNIVQLKPYLTPCENPARANMCRLCMSQEGILYPIFYQDASGGPTHNLPNKIMTFAAVKSNPPRCTGQTVLPHQRNSPKMAEHSSPYSGAQRVTSSTPLTPGRCHSPHSSPDMVGATTIREIQNNKSKLIEFASSVDSTSGLANRKTMKILTYAELDKVMLEWFNQKRGVGMPVSGSVCVKQPAVCRTHWTVWEVVTPPPPTRLFYLPGRDRRPNNNLFRLMSHQDYVFISFGSMNTDLTRSLDFHSERLPCVIGAEGLSRRLGFALPNSRAQHTSTSLKGHPFSAPAVNESSRPPPHCSLCGAEEGIFLEPGETSDHWTLISPVLEGHPFLAPRGRNGRATTLDTRYAPGGIGLPARVLKSHRSLVVLRVLHSGAGKPTTAAQHGTVPATITPQLARSIPGRRVLSEVVLAAALPVSISSLSRQLWSDQLGEEGCARGVLPYIYMPRPGLPTPSSLLPLALPCRCGGGPHASDLKSDVLTCRGLPLKMAMTLPSRFGLHYPREQAALLRRLTVPAPTITSVDLFEPPTKVAEGYHPIVQEVLTLELQPNITPVHTTPQLTATPEEGIELVLARPQPLRRPIAPSPKPAPSRIKISRTADPLQESVRLVDTRLSMATHSMHSGVKKGRATTTRYSSKRGRTATPDCTAAGAPTVLGVEPDLCWTTPSSGRLLARIKGIVKYQLCLMCRLGKGMEHKGKNERKSWSLLSECVPATSLHLMETPHGAGPKLPDTWRDLPLQSAPFSSPPKLDSA
ncbi:hypothetical protein PR048_020022 [Dryococelus australis]|uniref:Uncharacterized protein n=1 Tax=Dryococelus australis TaxID=614101 RepID=A0ABQ9H568_9NEOP|nr:hypothetical protein PR048_020022 [Dryococelus australis]